MLLDAAATVVVSVLSAYCFLRLRCRRRGNPFGARARWCSLSIIGALVLLSTGLGLAYVTLSHHYGATYVGLVLPSVLWLGRASVSRDDGHQPSTLADGLMYPLRRLDDLMGDDMQEWCDVRSRAVAGHPAWVSDAAHYYWQQVAGRVKDERTLRDVDRWRGSIEHKIKAARLADLDSPQRLRDMLSSHPSTRNPRKYHPDDARLADRLRSDAQNELHLFLLALYRLGFYDMLIYPFRSPAPAKRKRGQRETPADAEPTIR
jgi:hypothetical protein